MKKICFVCLGNICRSPMAEFIMKDLIQKDSTISVEVTSAGTSGYHDGEDMHIKTKEQLKKANIKADGFISKKLTQAICDNNDYIVVMDNSNFNNVLKDFKNTKNKILKLTQFAKELNYDEVPDPWFTHNFDETYKIISLACNNLLNFLKSN
ncbi:low molecular weight phosphotyrosine protein phosphatase [Campylobacter sp. TTU-622]|uniref:low molecular weight protein-tyrosine-phosphatase n=1 Tax=unclassified Campylobacter TaxID=2593542 RepID=UPI0019039E84|nr:MULTISPECIES: low molecular weight protein-tyrosine-phosphatase [unclassified Campylobacter]MBK1971630.1 low molecular weight phosphotyrosine protein phosphatase [Campylobacter sp. TTU_617]MBK1973180.1 low molecular weight phosphotyrosine protein phosphatase [Campylobacter sp. TTU-622]MBK1992117.1 low molecular weight phosphotyrosine protein phosphatase [Campylobacter sp. 2018MI34]